MIFGKPLWDDPSQVTTDILPKFGSQFNIGSAAFPFKAIYVDDITITQDLTINDDLTVEGGARFNGLSAFYDLATFNAGIAIDEGANESAGLATLVAGNAVVATTKAATGMRMLLIHQTPGGTMGHLSLGTIVNGTSFEINSDSNLDTSTVYWVKVTPA